MHGIVEAFFRAVVLRCKSFGDNSFRYNMTKFRYADYAYLCSRPNSRSLSWYSFDLGKRFPFLDFCVGIFLGQGLHKFLTPNKLRTDVNYFPRRKKGSAGSASRRMLTNGHRPFLPWSLNGSTTYFSSPARTATAAIKNNCTHSSEIVKGLPR